MPLPGKKGATRLRDRRELPSCSRHLRFPPRTGPGRGPRRRADPLRRRGLGSSPAPWPAVRPPRSSLRSPAATPPRAHAHRPGRGRLDDRRGGARSGHPQPIPAAHTAIRHSDCPANGASHPAERIRRTRPTATTTPGARMPDADDPRALSPREEKGSATIWSVSVLLLVSAAVGWALVWAAAESTRHSAEHAADSAAPAAAAAALHRLAMRDTTDPLRRSGRRPRTCHPRTHRLRLRAPWTAQKAVTPRELPLLRPVKPACRVQGFGPTHPPSRAGPLARPAQALYLHRLRHRHRRNPPDRQISTADQQISAHDL